MAFSGQGSLGSAQNKSAVSTWSPTTTRDLLTDNVVVVNIACDNLGTADGDNGDVVSVSVGGLALAKAKEQTNGNGATGTGATASQWWARTTGTIASGSAVAITFSGTVTAKAWNGYSWSFDTSKVPMLIDVQGLVNDAADPGNITASGLTSAMQYVGCRMVALETDSSTAITPTSSWQALGGAQTTGGAADTNIAIRGERRAFTSLTSLSSDPTVVSADSASVMGVWAETETHSGSATLTGGGILAMGGLKIGNLIFSVTGSGTVEVTESTDRSFIDSLTGGGELTVTAQIESTEEGRTLSTVALAEHLSAVLSDDWSVIQGPISSLEAPALVLRADSPWVQPSAYCYDLEQYAAIAVVTASSPADGERDLYGVILEVMSNLPEGWKFVVANAPVLDQSTGIALLAAKMTLTYANTEQEAS